MSCVTATIKITKLTNFKMKKTHYRQNFFIKTKSNMEKMIKCVEMDGRKRLVTTKITKLDLFTTKNKKKQL